MEFSHSETPGSKLASSSPGIIAGNHVLHRLVVPRHPSYALKYLTILCSIQINFCKSLGFLLYDHLTLLLPHKEYTDLYIRCAISLNLLQNCCIKTSLVKCLIYPYSLSNLVEPSLWLTQRLPSLKILVVNQMQRFFRILPIPSIFQMVSESIFSYLWSAFGRPRKFDFVEYALELIGIEPMTSRMQIWRSPSWAKAP